ncbi:hypothetical protein GCM10010112_67680 [Actinoplanes lobatus]|uniref:Uncharacterized protein n=1 Tax=Actinoplanes lobatus TaxID=113568 RepID=A0A7W7HFG6_9ACTN|nr:hypothetical protein [Actinoplanes lobatus]MBB4749152.1 hypothetical protein [Actinoplanes lobatus]GGN86301.1 hypothetical protein GCM10010112_67680 [Actinoplanes lobatus]GIE42750.1 hypothetical protein Alo02nite_56480 [Actinoplanes lobatus]
MTAQATDALVDAIEASYGLPVPTPREFAARIEKQLAARGYGIAQRSRCAEHGKVLPHFRCEESDRWLDEHGFPPGDGSRQ